MQAVPNFPRTTEDFARLTEACDRVLAAHKADDAVLANPFLHVLSGHPFSLEKYKTVGNRAALSQQRMRNLAARIATPLQGLIGDRFRAPNEKADVLIVSHALSQNQLDSGSNPYFGALPQYLAQRGHSVRIALINQSRQALTLPRAADGENPASVLLPRRLGFAEELGLQSRLSGAQKSLCASLQNLGIDPDIAAAACRFAEAAGAATALRLQHMIARVLEVTRPRLLLTTFEGHSWERLVYRSARQIDKNIVCAGFHHSVHFPQQHAMLRSLGPSLDPDVILASGAAGKSAFSASYIGTPTTVQTLGSAGKILKVAQALESDPPVCLVVPEGIPAEISLLCRTALSAATTAQNVRFVLRLHPLFKPADIAKTDSRFAELPANVVWSDASLEDDIARSTWCLYRGSSVAIAAAANGVHPLYLQDEADLFAVDPLAPSGHGGDVVSDADQLAAAVEAPAKKQSDRQTQRAKSAATYFTPMRPHIVAKLIQSSTTDVRAE